MVGINSMAARHFILAFAAPLACLPVAAFAEELKPPEELPSPPVRAKSSWSVSTGVSYSRGDYGDIADTEVISAPVSIRYRHGNWRFRLSMPFVHISGPGSLLQTPEGFGGGGGGGGDLGGLDGGGGGGGDGSGNSGSGSSGSGSSGSGSSGSGSSGSGSTGSTTTGEVGGVVTPGAPLADNRRSGLGDVSASLTYSAELGEGFYADITGKVKIPTASRTKRLGTGRVDFTASVDLIKDVGPATIYVTGRRKFAGVPAGSTIRSVWGAGGGASLRVARGLTFGADVDWQQSSFAGGQGSSEVTGWTHVRLSRSLGLTLYGGAGLNQASADVLGGATLSIRF